MLSFKTKVRIKRVTCNYFRRNFLFCCVSVGYDCLLNVVLVVQIHLAIDVVHVEQTVGEAAEFALLLLGPLHFGKGCKTWQQFPFELLGVGHPLCPYTSLGTDDVGLLAVGEFGKSRIYVINTLDARYAGYLIDARIGEVEVGDRSHYGLVSFLG